MDTGTEKNRLPEPGILKMYSGLTGVLTPILHLAKPLLSIYGGFRDTVPERLGKFSPVLDDIEKNRGKGKLVFIHAVSVGEAAVTGALIPGIRERCPDSLIVVSTTTFTGRDYIRRNFQPDALFFFPLDLPGVMKKLIDKLRPNCFIDIEVELWPNLIRALVNADVPMALANGRISDRAAAPPSILRDLYKWLFGSFDALFMRSDEDVRRVTALGAPESRTHLAGNLKFAACGEPPSQDERNRTREILGLDKNAKLLVAGSTHPGEDEQLIEGWLLLNEKLLPGGTGPVHLVLAPRHLEQVDRVKDLVSVTGEEVALWTDVRDSGSADGVRAIVVNTIGELMRLYGAADVAFVGGSLVERGGHNVLEPVAMGVPTMHGPSMANFNDLKKVLGEADLLYEVADSSELVETFVAILEEVDRERYRARARELISNQLKAADMIADWVGEKLA